jgi:hypothetical protein
MQNLLIILQEYTHAVAAHNAVARQNLEAAGTSADDVAQAHDQLRAEYEQFKQDCARDLDPIEVEVCGIPTFKEFREYKRHA